MRNYKLTLFLISFVFTISSCTNKQFELLDHNNCNYKITTTKNLADSNYVAQIDSIYNIGVEGYLSSKNNVKIYYKYFLQNPIENEKGAILISDGRTEAVVKYKEMIFDLYNNGYSIYIHDHRGQGFSGRMAPDRDMGFVDEFPNYIDDMKLFYDSILTKAKHKNIYLLAHSMGGAIGMSYLEQYPSDFKAAAFSSPMLGLGFPTCMLIGILTGDEPEYAMGSTNYEDGIEPFNKNTLTNCEVRYQRMLDVFDLYPKARLGGASYQWVYKSCKAFNNIFKDYPKIETPIILFSGEQEEVVDPSAHNEFIDLLVSNGQNAKGFLVKNAKHELFIEKDSVRTSVICKALSFYEQN